MFELARVIVAFLSAACIVMLLGATEKLNIRERSRVVVSTRMRKTALGLFNYERLDLFLSRHGAHYMFEHLEPVTYLFLKTVLGTLLALLGVVVYPILLPLPFFLLGFWSMDGILMFSNASDNDNMMSDIKKIYDTLRIQAKAGVFLNDSLMECYLLVKNKRLKAAMLELVNQIAAKNNIEDAIDSFGVKFKCAHIDTLCIVIKQSLQSGKTVQILTDISTQISFIQHAIAMKQKSKVERKIELLELLIYIGIMALGIYALGTEFDAMLLV